MLRSDKAMQGSRKRAKANRLGAFLLLLGVAACEAAGGGAPPFSGGQGGDAASPADGGAAGGSAGTAAGGGAVGGEAGATGGDGGLGGTGATGGAGGTGPGGAAGTGGTGPGGSGGTGAAGGAAGAGGTGPGGAAGTGGTGSGGAAGTGGTGGAPLVGLPYPTRDQYQFKGLQPDYWSNYDEIAANNLGGVSINLIWENWEPSVDNAPCGSNQQEYQGRCYQIDYGAENAIKEWTSRGVVVTGVLYGVPAWARTGNTNCSPNDPVDFFDMFCAPDGADEFARFAGMLAHRFNGSNGHGRVADFAIHNEVNHNVWFDIGCGSGTACNLNAWIDDYSANYAAAYDQIKSQQSEAKVLVPFTGHFDTSYDLPNDPYPSISIKTFLARLSQNVGDREWKIAIHPYPKDMTSPAFTVSDLPSVTFGNLGILPGYLRATFPAHPHAWEVLMTEQGVSSGSPNSTEAAQASAICDAYRNALGTPGISTFIYFRMKDSPDDFGLAMGLARSDKTKKPSFTTWSIMNKPGSYGCGFEDLPYTVLTRSFNPSTGKHWASSRRAPSGFVTEASVGKLSREQVTGTELVYECAANNYAYSFLTKDIGCGGNRLMGPVGWIWTASGTGLSPLYSCSMSADRFVSVDADCEGQTVVGLLGYVKA